MSARGPDSAGPGGRPPGRGSLGEDDDDDLHDDDRDSLIDVPGGVRLQKVLAAAGVGSRRHCEELIGEGRVEVDGETVRRFGARVDPEHQVIRVDGKRIPSRQDLVYLALNKPAGVLTTMSDDRGRPTIADFLEDYPERLYHVGRLDYDTEGLMLLMNDGELAHRLAHPSYGVLKTYLADVPGPLPRPGLVPTGDGPAAGIEVEVWDIPHQGLGLLLPAIAAPLGLGQVRLDDGQVVTGFVADPTGLGPSDDISAVGSWRAYLDSR